MASALPRELHPILRCIRPGTVTALAAENGVGRTTLMFHLMAHFIQRGRPAVWVHHGHILDREQQETFLKAWPEVKGYTYPEVGLDFEPAMSAAKGGILCLHNIHTWALEKYGRFDDELLITRLFLRLHHSDVCVVTATYPWRGYFREIGVENWFEIRHGMLYVLPVKPEISPFIYPVLTPYPTRRVKQSSELSPVKPLEVQVKDMVNLVKEAGSASEEMLDRACRLGELLIDIMMKHDGQSPAPEAQKTG